MFSFIWPGVATPSAKNEVHNRSALLVLALATLMDDLLPKSNQAGLPNKSSNTQIHFEIRPKFSLNLGEKMEKIEII